MKGKNIMLYTHSFANTRRDLADIFSSVIKDEPRFISNFKRVADATARKHEWLEDQISGRAVTALSASDNTLTLSAGEGKKLRLGTLVTLDGDSALFAVKTINITITKGIGRIAAHNNPHPTMIKTNLRMALPP